MITAEQLKDVIDRTEALKHYLNIDSKLIQVEEEQLRTQARVSGMIRRGRNTDEEGQSLQGWIDGYNESKNCLMSYLWQWSLQRGIGLRTGGR